MSEQNREPAWGRGARPVPDKYRFSELGGLASTLRLLLTVEAVFFAALAIWVSIAWITQNFEMFGVLTIFERPGTIILLLIYTLGTLVFYFIWLYRATANLWVLEPSQAEIYAGWAVGWYFIPIANLWMPYKAMRQLVAVFGGRCGWWWFFSLAGAILLNGSQRVLEDASSQEAVYWALRGLIAGWAFYAIAAWMTVVLVRQVTRAQSDEHARRSAAPPPVPANS